MDQISIVIPTHRRIEALRRTIDSLAKQELDGLEAELIVVCSGSVVGHSERVSEAVAGHPLPARVLSRPEGGSAGARNAGVEAAASDLILFLNDDTPPASTDLVVGHARAHDEDTDPWRGVLGPVVWDPHLAITPVMDWMSRTGKMNDYAGLEAEGEGTPTLYAPGLSIHRSALVAVGGFDERFSRYGWAEYDLALRLFDRGFRIAFRPDLVAWHDHRYTLGDSLRRMESVGRAANLLNRVHAARDELATPRPAGAKGRAARLLAPAATYVPVPGWMPGRLRDQTYRTLHYAMLARGYAQPEIPAGNGMRGGIGDGKAPAPQR